MPFSGYDVTCTFFTVAILTVHNLTKYLLIEIFTNLFPRFELLLQEKEEIEAEYLEFKSQMHSSAKGALSKEVKILKGIVKNQEEELLSEKSKYQRAIAKRTQERKQLMEEVIIEMMFRMMWVLYPI